MVEVGACHDDDVIVLRMMLVHASVLGSMSQKVGQSQLADSSRGSDVDCLETVSQSVTH